MYGNNPALPLTAAGVAVGGTSLTLGTVVGIGLALIVVGGLLYRFGSRKRRYVPGA